MIAFLLSSNKMCDTVGTVSCPNAPSNIHGVCLISIQGSVYASAEVVRSIVSNVVQKVHISGI